MGVEDRNAWERRPDEGDKAHAALMDYLMMGRGRSLAKLADRYRDAAEAGPALPPTKRLNTLKEWSGKYDWQNRAAAWDAAQDEAELELWQERRRQVRERDWDQGAGLRDLAAAVLAEGPNFVKRVRREVQAGRPMVVDQAGNVIDRGAPAKEVITLALDAKLMIQALEAASKLQRLAAGMPDSHAEISGLVAEIAADDLAVIRDEMEAWERERFSSTGNGNQSGPETGG